MRRATTTVFLAGWFGFLAVSAATAALAILRAANVWTSHVPFVGETVDRLALSLLLGGNGEILAATVAAVAASVIGALLALAIWLLRAASPEDRASGDRIAFGALASAAALIAGLRVGDFVVFDQTGSVFAFAAILALSMLAILLDRLTEPEDEDEYDDAGLRAAAALIGQEMARDAAMRADADRRRQTIERR